MKASSIKFIVGAVLLIGRLSDLLGGRTGFVIGGGSEGWGYNAFIAVSYIGGAWLIYSAIQDIRKKSVSSSEQEKK